MVIPPIRPHDALFRALLDDPARAAALMRAHLPAALTACLSDALPEPVEGSFIDDALRESRADRLFRLSLADGRPAFLYILLEHKSSPDPGTPLQLLGYMARIWQRHAGRDSERLLRLPPIIPLVVYHGATAWTVPESVLDCLDAGPALLPWLQGFRYILRDLGHIPYEQLAADRAVRAVLGALKHAFRDPATRNTLIRLLADLPDGHVLEIQVLRYIAQVYDTSPDELDAALGAAKPERKETLMPTIAEVWTQQALAKGRLEGRLEGRTEAKVETMLRLVRKRFGPVPESAVDRIRQAGDDQLDRWIEDLLDAPSLEALLGGSRTH